MNAVSLPHGHSNDRVRSEQRSRGHVPSSFRVATLASVLRLRDSYGDVALDGCVPSRANREAALMLEGRGRLVYRYVDGVQSLEEIANKTKLSMPEVIEVCMDLVARGTVRLSSETKRR